MRMPRGGEGETVLKNRERKDVAISEIRQERVARDAERALGRALAAAQTAHENRGRDIQILDLRELTSVFDFFIIVTGASRRQLHAIAEEVDRVMETDFGDRRLA